MKAPITFGLVAAGVAILHFAAVFVTALFLWLGGWGSGPQGGEVSITPEERRHREQIKPYEEAFMVLLRSADKTLAFPMSLKGSRGFRRPGTAVLNSAIWGLSISTVALIMGGRKKPKAQPPLSPDE
jgi:hypothetical protein